MEAVMSWRYTDSLCPYLHWTLFSFIELEVLLTVLQEPAMGLCPGQGKSSVGLHTLTITALFIISHVQWYLPYKYFLEAPSLRPLKNKNVINSFFFHFVPYRI